MINTTHLIETINEALKPYTREESVKLIEFDKVNNLLLLEVISDYINMESLGQIMEISGDCNIGITNTYQLDNGEYKKVLSILIDLYNYSDNDIPF